MNVRIMSEYGFDEAMIGLSLNKEQPIENMPEVGERLAGKDRGHDKFLRFLIVYLDITAPRRWWQEFDTYKVGLEKQSESTMNTILKRELTQESFENPIYPETLSRLNEDIRKKDFYTVKDNLPESYLQRRIIITNYATIFNMIIQRHKHKQREWQIFVKEIDKLKHRKFLEKIYDKYKIQVNASECQKATKSN